MKKIYFTLLGLSLFLTEHAQTIPCPGFETWVNSNESGATYLVPQNWVTVDQLQNAFTPTYTGTSTFRTTSSQAGQYAAMMQTTLNGSDTVSGGLISTASINDVFNAIFGGGGTYGFQYTTRSANLQGYFKFTKVGGDTGKIMVIMTKWNSTLQQRDTLAMVPEFMLGTNTASYTLFSIPLTYSLNLFPDTCAIVAALDGPNGGESHVGSQFFLDGLTFVGTVPVGISELLGGNELIRVYPNPFTNNATFELSTEVSLNNTKVVIYDVLGKEVKTLSDLTGYKMNLERGDLQSGLYFFRLLNEGELITGGKFVIE